jgi:hypothetical protein
MPAPDPVGYLDLAKQVYDRNSPAVLTCHSKAEALSTKLRYHQAIKLARKSLPESHPGINESFGVTVEVVVGPDRPPTPETMDAFLATCRFESHKNYQLDVGEAWYVLVSPNAQSRKVHRFDSRLIMAPPRAKERAESVSKSTSPPEPPITSAEAFMKVFGKKVSNP